MRLQTLKVSWSTYVLFGIVACSSATDGATFGTPGGESSSGANGANGDSPTSGTLGNDDGLGGDAGLGGETSTPSLCGNGVKNAETETCDDGNMANGDGCSSGCRVENGWSCPVAGARCLANQCGDGIVAGDEECDDGAITNDGGTDGCVACRLVEGFKCPTPGVACVRTTCNDRVVEGTEQCDDGNNDPFDGCDPTCHIEPVCANGSCTSACGDGLKFPSEACDDGNRNGGDGCSPTCTLEPGYTCDNAQGAAPMFKDLYIVYRDFMGVDATFPDGGAGVGHPDFERPFWSTNPPNFDVVSTGLIQNTLDMQGRPAFASSQGTGNYEIIQDATTFSSWYRDTMFSKKTVTTMRLGKQMDGTYQFDSAAFFPIDPQTATTWPQRDSGHNFHFTSELRIPFTYKGGEALTFRGDDDVWVFVNGRLAVDLGGIKNPRSGTVTLSGQAATDLGLIVGGMYEFAVFQAERHVTGSNYQLTLTDFDRLKTSCTSICGDGIKTPDEACDLGTALNDGQYGHCSADCRSRGEYCGDGIRQAQEECDSTLGCTPDCRTPDHAPR